MDITSIHDQPTEVKSVQLDRRSSKESKERTATFTVDFDYSSNILKIISYSDQDWNLAGLWDDDENPRPGIESVKFNREFLLCTLEFKRNNRSVLSIRAEKLHSFAVKPKKGGILGVRASCLVLCGEGDAERLHKITKDPGITMTITHAEGSQEGIE